MIEAMKIGDVTPPLRTTRGYQILKLGIVDAERRPRRSTRRARQIADSVLNDKRKREFLKYLDKLRAQAIIEWKNAEIREGLRSKVSSSRPRRRRTPASN